MNTEQLSARILETFTATQPQGKLPSERELAEKLGTSRHQVRKVLTRLARQGAVEPRQGSGTLLASDFDERLKTPFHVYCKRYDPPDPEAAILADTQRVESAIIRRLGDVRMVPVYGRGTGQSMKVGGSPALVVAGHPGTFQLISQDIAQDITKESADWPDFQKIRPNLIAPVCRQGRIHAVPTSAAVFVLAANVQRMRACGLLPHHPPANWDELAVMAGKMTAAARGYWGLSLHAQTYPAWLFVDLCHQAGGSVIESDDHAWRPVFDQAHGVAALEFLRRLQWEEKVMPPAGEALTAPAKAFAEGRIGLWWTTADKALEAIAQSGRPPAEFELYPLPAGPQGHAAHQVSICAAVINAFAPEEEREAAWRYVEARYGIDGQMKMGRALWAHRRVRTWPPIYRSLTPRQTGVDLPESWFRLLSHLVASGVPEPAGMGWNGDLLMGAAIRNVLSKQDADPREELAHAARLAIMANRIEA